MKSLFDAGAVTEIQGRLARLGPSAARQWGHMDVAQALAHCSAGLEQALGERRPPRVMIGRLLGWLIKPLALGNDEPMRRNSPTVEELVVSDPRDFAAERARLLATIDRFARGGPSGCTTHPHPFFGRLTPQQWSGLMYKHLDHHLRQFGG